MRIPVNTQHPAWRYENAVVSLNANDSAEWLLSTCKQPISISELVTVMTGFQYGSISW